MFYLTETVTLYGAGFHRKKTNGNQAPPLTNPANPPPPLSKPAPPLLTLPPFSKHLKSPPTTGKKTSKDPGSQPCFSKLREIIWAQQALLCSRTPVEERPSSFSQDSTATGCFPPETKNPPVRTHFSSKIRNPKSLIHISYRSCGSMTSLILLYCPQLYGFQILCGMVLWYSMTQ